MDAESGDARLADALCKAQEDPPFLLLVDDEKAFADALAFRLGTRGFFCQTAYRGQEALDLLDQRDLEVILLDLNMPGTPGLDLLKIIKTRRPDVEVLLLTSEADLSVAATGMRRGAGDYLVKPVDFDALLESLNKARKRVREHRERLRAADAVKLMALGALAAGVGHEINNPLQVILERSGWLRELVEDAQNGRPDFAEMLDSVTMIRQQVVRARQITAQLLELAYKSREGLAECDPGEIARRVAGYYQDRADELGISIRLEINPQTPLLPCSPAELEPVLSHLVRNALDAVEVEEMRHPAGTGTFSPEMPTPDMHAVGIRISPYAGGVRIEVQDTGGGIAPDRIAHIYNPFFSSRPVGKGTGLGLTVCHSIVTALGGTIDYAPAPGRGAVFTVDLPGREPHTLTQKEDS
ncbi:response regulator [Desulfosarcina sp. OttesenSCG-928-G17]|nr:response regulator [Desulfosarcina sp. OttesenSCG-928-G17]